MLFRSLGVLDVLVKGAFHVKGKSPHVLCISLFMALNRDFYNVKIRSRIYMAFALMMLNCLVIAVHSIASFRY